MLMTFLLFCLVLTAGNVAAQNEIKLPAPQLTGKLSVEQALIKKKSYRSFSGKPITFAEVGQMLWAAGGNVPDSVTGATQKVIPSAGGLYPLEFYLLVGKDLISEIPAGIYRFNPGGNSLQLLSAGDSRNLLAHAAFQPWIGQAPAIIVIGAEFQRTTVRYANRGVNYVYMEAGNSNQNLYLQAESLGLRIGTVGAFNDAQVSAVLKLPQNITPLLIIPFGR